MGIGIGIGIGIGQKRVDGHPLDIEKLLQQVTEEVARRFAHGPGTGVAGGAMGPPFCAACSVPGTCATTCADRVRGALGVGAKRVSAALGTGQVEGDLASLIDHTLLKPEATKEEVRTLCAEAARYHFASVCVNTFWVPYCTALLQGHGVPICAVVGFPLGAMATDAKAAETRYAVEHGAVEIDMVQNVGALKSGLLDLVEADVRAVRKAAGPSIVLKVILETALLNDAEKVQSCRIAVRAGADFVKTSTGFSKGGATAADIALMRRTVGEELGVKASGGVRDAATARLMVGAGASRIGASASVQIVERPPPTLPDPPGGARAAIAG